MTWQAGDPFQIPWQEHPQIDPRKLPHSPCTRQVLTRITTFHSFPALLPRILTIKIDTPPSHPPPLRSRTLQFPQQNDAQHDARNQPREEELLILIVFVLIVLIVVFVFLCLPPNQGGRPVLLQAPVEGELLLARPSQQPVVFLVEGPLLWGKPGLGPIHMGVAARDPQEPDRLPQCGYVSSGQHCARAYPAAHSSAQRLLLLVVVLAV